MTARDPLTATDIRIRGAWERAIPLWLVPYSRLARWDRPIGSWLLLLPCWWGAALAAAGAPGVSAVEIALLFALFAVGAVAMRGAGCAYNDIVDRDFDARVSRTAIRPLPAGHVGLGGAWIFVVLQCAVGLAVLLALDRGAVWVGLGAIPLVAAYPFMKRFSHWPQAWLGLAFNWGALVGWAAIAGEVEGPAYALYAAGIAWTLGYDTIYAHQDKEDDALAGVKSTALLFGGRTRLWVAGFYAAAAALLALAGWRAGLAWPFYAGIAAAAAQLAWQVRRLDIDDPDLCLALFRSNRLAGLLALAAIALGMAA